MTQEKEPEVFRVVGEVDSINPQNPDLSKLEKVDTADSPFWRGVFEGLALVEQDVRGKTVDEIRIEHDLPSRIEELR